MFSKYIIRFDDICPTMNWGIWKKIEKVLIQEKISPILAIVPDNQDEHLKVDEPHLEFWEAVRSWQARGWTIGVHGYQHKYVSNHGGVLGINNQSEFAALDEKEQESKLNNALAIFRLGGITPEVWVAPSHSFDLITLRVLKKLKLDVVSDGLSLSPYTDSLGITHIPQQLWRLRRMPFGLWTVCYHHNGWTQNDVDRFRSDIQRYRDDITSLHHVLKSYRPRSQRLSDALFSCIWMSALRSRKCIGNLTLTINNRSQ